ncbi:MAG: hypothetical protein ACREFE_13115 [Limisphaerales bacterium]
MRRLLKVLIVTALLATGCRSTEVSSQPSDLPVRYYDSRYGLTLFLPNSWRGYSVSIQQVGDEIYSPTVDKPIIVAHTPLITLRHPHWQASLPYQDILIFIFTHSQWDSLNHGGLWPSYLAGGVMDELWHNDKYVFAMSNRTLYDTELKDEKEAEDIVKRNYSVHKMQHLYPE